MSGKGVDETTLELARKGRDEVYNLRLNDESVLWIPPEAKHLQVRLMTSVHMRPSSYRGAGAILKRLGKYYLSPVIEEDAREFIRMCL